MSDDSDVSEVELSDEGQSQAGDQFLRTARVPRPSDHTDASYESDEQYNQQLKSISVSAPANSWQDVDREQLSQTVLRLISSVAQTAPTDDKSRDAVWHPTTTITMAQNLNDPLGFGIINLNSRRLVAPDDDQQQQQQHLQESQTAAAAAAGRSTAAAGQGRGAVGRFFSEFTKSSSPAKSKHSSHRDSTRSNKRPNSGTSSSDVGHCHRSDSVATRGVLSTIQASKLLPSAEGFDPKAYLAVFHEGSTAADLAKGLRALERELGESTGQLKQLVKQNFERFISCKTTIDDIYTKLQRIESTSTGISTEVLYQAIQEVQSGAGRVFGPILERAGKAERIRSVQLLLRRFQGLFSAPDRIRALTAARDFEQVTVEYRKANALIKPGPKTVKVWISLYAEIEKRVTDVYHQLEAEVQDPLLPAAAASELVIHMLQLQAEGLAAAAGADPLALLLAAREAQFTATMQAVTADHERAVARLKTDIAAAAADDKLQDPAAITESQLLKWNGSWTNSSSDMTLHNAAAAAAAAVAGSSGMTSVHGSRHLSDLAPLSGLQPPAPRSRLVLNTYATPGEVLYLRHLQCQSGVLLECLPGLWQAAGAGAANKLQLPLNLTAAAMTKIQGTVAGAAKILERLVRSYSDSASHIIAAIAAAGPLREALLLAAEELASTLSHLESQKAPAAAVAAVAAVLGACVSAGVQQLVVHLSAVPGWLLSHESWLLSVTHSGDQPVTQMPKQLQEEVTVVMQYYQQLLACSSTPSSSSGAATSATAKFLTADKSTKPIREAYFACLEDTVKCCRAAADHLRPAGAAGSSSAVPGASSSTTSKLTTYEPLLADSDDEDTARPTAAASSIDSAAAGAALRPRQLTDDIRLLLLASNLCFMRSRLVGGLTQRFLLVLTGEATAEVERCSRYVVKLAGRLDGAVQGIHQVYLDRKRHSIDRLIAQYIKADGSAVGAPPELRDVSVHAQRLVALVTSVMSETYTYARSSMQQLLHSVLEHIGSSISTAFANLPAGVSSAASGCPVECLGQYFMDLVFLDATLSKAGPSSLSVDLTAAYHLLATRICGGGSSSSRDRSSAETPLAHSLLAVKDPQELSRKLQVTCRKALRDVLERSSFTLRSLLAPATAAATSSTAG